MLGEPVEFNGVADADEVGVEVVVDSYASVERQGVSLEEPLLGVELRLVYGVLRRGVRVRGSSR